LADIHAEAKTSAFQRGLDFANENQFKIIVDTIG
jgi:hypothetical protein